MMLPALQAMARINAMIKYAKFVRINTSQMKPNTHDGAYNTENIEHSLVAIPQILVR